MKNIIIIMKINGVNEIINNENKIMIIMKINNNQHNEIINQNMKV